MSYKTSLMATPPTAPTESSREHAGQSYSELVVAELKDEDERKESLERRGAAVVSVSVSLASLLFAALAIAKTTTGLVLSPGARAAAVWSIAAFAVAAILGTAASWPLKYRSASSASLLKLTELSYWIGDRPSADRRIAQMRIEKLDVARAKNARKAKILIAGMVAEAVAVALVVITIALIL